MIGRTIKCRSCRKTRFIFFGDVVCVHCKEKRRRRAAGLCTAILHCGPGHQSHGYCARRVNDHEMLNGRKVHWTRYHGEDAEWFGPEKSTGYFDEVPDLEHLRR